MNGENLFIICIAMIFCHLLYDFHLQGCLANLKQEKWWRDQLPNKEDRELFGYDYIAGLIAHSVEWSIWINLPLIIFRFCCENPGHIGTFAAVSILLNSIIHGFVDDIKANKHKINLHCDQAIHYMQIAVTFVSYILVFKLI